MAVFKSARYVPGAVSELAPVAQDLENHFLAQGFEVHKERTVAGGWRIDISKGGTFKSVLGMKSALSVEIEPAAAGTQVKAGVGIFGQQAIPTAISMLIFWPVLLTQLWGMIQQSSLDDEAIDTVERSIAAHAPTASLERAAGLAQPTGKFCTSCGHALTVPARFCPQCGAKLV